MNTSELIIFRHFLLFLSFVNVFNTCQIGSLAFIEFCFKKKISCCKVKIELENTFEKLNIFFKDFVHRFEERKKVNVLFL